MARSLSPIPGDDRLVAMRRLVRRVRRLRGRRVASRPRAATPGQDGTTERRLRAEGLLAAMLRSRFSGRVDCARFFATLVTRLQLASAVISQGLSSVARLSMGAEYAVGLAVVIAELVNYFEESVPPGGAIRVCLALSRRPPWLVVAVGVEGDAGPVSTASATVTMLAARDLVVAMGGEFSRGAHGDRLVFLLTFPASFVEPVA